MTLVVRRKPLPKKNPQWRKLVQGFSVMFEPAVSPGELIETGQLSRWRVGCLSRFFRSVSISVERGPSIAIWLATECAVCIGRRPSRRSGTYANLAEARELLAGYEEFDAFTDMEYLDEFGTTYLEGYKLYPHLAAQYPNAVFILNTRNREDWISKPTGTWKKNILCRKRAMAFYGAASIDQLTERWRAEWNDHHCRVTEFFAGKPHRFFVCPIETDLPHLLNDMLPECKLDTKHYRLEAKTTWRQHLSSHHLSSDRDASFAGAFPVLDGVVSRAGRFSNRAGLRQILTGPWLKHAL